ncbi:hypothetical protein ACFSYB_03605 [Litchfieldia salsa]
MKDFILNEGLYSELLIGNVFHKADEGLYFRLLMKNVFHRVDEGLYFGLLMKNVFHKSEIKTTIHKKKRSVLLKN